MKIRQLVYYNRLNIPFFELMKQHPRILKASTSITKDKVRCDLMTGPKKIESSYKYKGSVTATVCEIDKDDFFAVLKINELTSPYAERQMKELVEKIAICRAFSADEITKFVSEHPKYRMFDDEMTEFMKNRTVDTKPAYRLDEAESVKPK